MIRSDDYWLQKTYAAIVIFLCFFLIAGILLASYPVNIITGSTLFLLSGLSLCILCCVVFIVNPDLWLLLAAPHFLFSLGALIFGQIEISVLAAIAAAGIALIRGFFREHWKRKVIILLAVYLIFVISQVRFSLMVFLQTLGISVFLGSVLTMLVMELRFSLANVLPPEIRVPVPGKSRTELNLSSYDLSQRDLYALYAVLCNHTYAQIGDRLNCSTSTVKQMMRRIFQQFGVSDRTEFTELLGHFDLIPPSWYRVPEEFASFLEVHAAPHAKEDKGPSA